MDAFKDGFRSDTFTDFDTRNSSGVTYPSGVAEITDYADLVTNHIVLSSPPIEGSPHGVIIVDGLGNSIELYGVGEQDFKRVTLFSDD